MNKYSLVSMRDLSKDDMIHILNDALLFSNSNTFSKDSINNMYGIKKELVLNYFKSLTTLFKNPFFAILFSTK